MEKSSYRELKLERKKAMKKNILALLVLVGGLVCAAGSAPTLEEGFLDPPKANRPQVW